MNNSDLLIIISILILCYSFFSASETSFSSLNKIKIKALANAGNKRPEKTYELTENFSKLLTTILIGNTIVNVVSASLATVLFTNLFGAQGVTVSSIVMTLMIMIIGEFVGVLSGSLIIESIFGVPGTGALYINSITALDYTFFLLLYGFYTIIGLSANIVVDISYGFIDPRIRMGSKK